MSLIISLRLKYWYFLLELLCKIWIIFYQIQHEKDNGSFDLTSLIFVTILFIWDKSKINLLGLFLWRKNVFFEFPDTDLPWDIQGHETTWPCDLP